MAGVVGYAGALLTLMLQGVYANNLGWQRAGDSLLMTVLGGVHHFLGPLWGAIVFILLENRLSAITENWWLMFAPIISRICTILARRHTGISAASAQKGTMDADAEHHPAAAGHDQAV